MLKIAKTVDKEEVISSKDITENETKISCDVASNEKNQKSSNLPPESEAKYDLKNFALRRVLNNNTRNKSISLLGSFPNLSDSDKAIIIFEKRAFQESDVTTNTSLQNGGEQLAKADQTATEEEKLIKPSYFCPDLKVETEFVNNIYGSYQITPPANLNGVKATVVYPATENHIQKYSICQKFLINETADLYKNITLPYITSCQFSLEWVYNILEHKQEADRIIYEDPDPENGFILLPDLKWDGRNVENLYVLAIVRKRDIKSLRDLNSSHLPLLRNIRTGAAAALKSRYDITSTQLRMYFHYQPSFYHLHIHINPIRNDAPGIWCEKSHMLDTVINNLELLPDYYQKSSLPFVLYDGSRLLDLYENESNMQLRQRKKLKTCAENDEESNEDNSTTTTN